MFVTCVGFIGSKSTVGNCIENIAVYICVDKRSQPSSAAGKTARFASQSSSGVGDGAAARPARLSSVSVRSNTRPASHTKNTRPSVVRFKDRPQTSSSQRSAGTAATDRSSSPGTGIVHDRRPH